MYKRQRLCREKIKITRGSFWLEVGRALRACDSARRNKDAKDCTAANGTAATATALATATAVASATGLPTDYGEDSWLRFFVVRKGNAPAAGSSTALSNGSAASEKAARRTGRARAPGPPEVGWG